MTEVLRYEARPTRMFGAYLVWAQYADGSGRQIAHGDPQFCLREAERLNREMAMTAEPGVPNDEKIMTVTPGIRLDVGAEDWECHRFGLSADRWRNLRGRTFWITGAGSGYGRAIATALAAAGSHVFLSGRREAVLAEAIDAVRETGIDSARCHAVPADVTDWDSVAAAGERVSGLSQGRLLGLVSCAALPQHQDTPWPLSDMPLDRWDRMMSTNVTGQLHVARASLPLMAAAGAARAVFLTSEAGWASTPGVGPYNVSKAALNSLVASLAAENAARYPEADIQINALDPGEARTEMNRGSPVSPYAAVPMTLALLSHPPGGPNGRFFHRDGRHFGFAYAEAWRESLLDGTEAGAGPAAAAGDPSGLPAARLLGQLAGWLRRASNASRRGREETLL